MLSCCMRVMYYWLFVVFGAVVSGLVYGVCVLCVACCRLVCLTLLCLSLLFVCGCLSLFAMCWVYSPPLLRICEVLFC